MLTIQSNKDKELEKIQQEIDELTWKKKQTLQDIQQQINERDSIGQELIRQKERLQQFYDQKEENVSSIIYEQEQRLKDFKDSSSRAYDNYEQKLENQYLSIEKEFDDKIQSLKEQEKETVKSLNKLKDSLSAGVQAQLREQAKKDSLSFYKLNPNSIMLADIQVLNQVKLSLHQPVVLSKLIWTTYFQKPTTEMCNRILGTNKRCGIYKITNINTQQCYIGQSVDISSRWKDHIKCGLGIDASATNKLYNAMQKDGVWNFTFELLEECPRELLNEKEKFWISLYQSDKFGYNSTKGGS